MKKIKLERRRCRKKRKEKGENKRESGGIKKRERRDKRRRGEKGWPEERKKGRLSRLLWLLSLASAKEARCPKVYVKYHSDSYSNIPHEGSPSTSLNYMELSTASFVGEIDARMPECREQQCQRGVSRAQGTQCCSVSKDYTDMSLHQIAMAESTSEASQGWLVQGQGESRNSPVLEISLLCPWLVNSWKFTSKRPLT